MLQTETNTVEMEQRARLIRIKEKECRRLEARIRKELQFNRRVEINSELRRCRAELGQLLEP
jgi:hypothetical protein